MINEYLVRVAKKTRKKYTVEGDIIQFFDGNTLTTEDIRAYEIKYQKKYPDLYAYRYDIRGRDYKKGTVTFLQFCVAECQKKFSEKSIRKVSFAKNINDSDLCMLGFSKKLLEKIGVIESEPYVSLEFKGGKIIIKKAEKKFQKKV